MSLMIEGALVLLGVAVLALMVVVWHLWGKLHDLEERVVKEELVAPKAIVYEWAWPTHD